MRVGNPIDAYEAHTGYNLKGGIRYLDRHKVYCENYSLLSFWQLENQDDVKINFICRSYRVKSYNCQDRFTAYNEEGDGIKYLDRHMAMCALGEAMKGFEGQWGCWKKNWWGCQDGFRWKYTCCSADSFDPTRQPVAKPTNNPLSEPDSPTLKPTYSPISTPTVKPTYEPTKIPTLEPTIGKPPPDVSRQEVDNLSEEGKEDVLVINEDRDSIPPQPEKQPMDPLEADPLKEIMPLQEKLEEEFPAPFSIGNVKICPFTFTKKASRKNIPEGCAIISTSILDLLKVNATAPSAYICGYEQAMLNDASLIRAGFLRAEKKSYVSDIIPGPQTSVSFFTTSDFTQTDYTFTSGFHPYLTKINLNGGVVKSLIFKSTSSMDISYPEECLM
jgi:hypothetical protein